MLKSINLGKRPNPLYILMSAAASSALGRAYAEKVCDWLYKLLPPVAKVALESVAGVASQIAAVSGSAPSWPHVPEVAEDVEPEIDFSAFAKSVSDHTEKAAASADDILSKLVPK